ncbi:GNAT family N-acetyltransferase [Bifidobacterium apri]|uniref:Ribosomal-protein-S5-alanine acetyltransferase n=1 Tax=Bifidobacterium apri TaxID=1769423 RepID=A0A6A2VA42_9BIFI|nr:ribosomal-protein-S5-alanine acetyltransferase [Bifidobacterium apri]
MKAMSVLQSLRGIMHDRRPREFVMPKTLTAPSGATPIGLRPCTLDDEDELQALRWRNQAWLSPWDSDDPLGGPGLTFNQWVCDLRRREREGSGALFVIVEHGRIVGQVSLGAITYGAMRSGLAGYWVDEAVAGRGIAPLAVAMLADWAFDCPDGPRLHRIEIAIIPDNYRSRRVAQKLGAIDEGLRRQYMHVNGRWRDHESYVLFAQDRPAGGLAAALAAHGQVPRAAA